MAWTNDETLAGIGMIPVIEIGGTHASACLVDLANQGSLTPVHRLHFDGDPDVPQFSRILSELIERLRGESGFDPSTNCAVAIPGPFDYELGVARFHDVGKFEALNGLDVGQLLDDLGLSRVHFLNDGDAFGLGEAEFGAGNGLSRVVCLTLGTGVGSAFVRNGKVVHCGADVPPEGYAHLATLDGQPLEDVMSRRALIQAWKAVSGLKEDVREITEHARARDARAMSVLDAALDGLGRALGPYFADFGAQLIIVGGSIAQAWDLVEPMLSASLRRQGLAVPVEPAARPSESPFLGAAWAARQSIQ